MWNFCFCNGTPSGGGALVSTAAFVDSERGRKCTFQSTHCVPGTVLGTSHGFSNITFHVTQDFGITVFSLYGKKLGAL